MTAGFIDTRNNAEKEAKALIRRARRDKFFPILAADTRRRMAQQNLKVARMWREQGEIETAVRVACTARGHLIIARAYDREAARIGAK